MGFGILFIGYYFFINLTYYAYTDVIGALILLLAFYKLRELNSPMRAAFYLLLPFCLFAFFELIMSVLPLIFPSLSGIVQNPVCGAVRYAFVGALTYLMLCGLGSVSSEVGLAPLAARCRVTRVFPPVVYGAAIICEIPALFGTMPQLAQKIVVLVILCLIAIVVFLNLVTIYSCYMHICMPGDEDAEARRAPGKFEKRQTERSREYAEYRLKRAKPRLESQPPRYIHSEEERKTDVESKENEK